MKKLILLTGSHRSGSTWAGEVISQAPFVRYVHEPFNLDFDKKNSPLKHWFEYLNKKPQSKQKEFKNYLKSFYLLFHPLYFRRALQINSPKEAKLFFKDFFSRIFGRTLIKDPIAVMSAEWIYQNFDCKVIVMIRHPAAFTASLKVKDWGFDFNDFLNQKDLMEDYLKDYRLQVRRYAKNPPDIIEQGILLWNMIYSTVLKLKKKYKHQWYFVRHEDLSKNPIKEYKKIFKFLDIKFNKKTGNYIIESTKARKQTQNKRNSKKNIKTWKKRLTKSQIDLIEKKTEKVWRHFYKKRDWR